jgi:hypothetical protein
MTATADQRRLEPLDVFVGEWSLATSLAPNPADAPRARTTFEWLPGRRFLIQRSLNGRLATALSVPFVGVLSG